MLPCLPNVSHTGADLCRDLQMMTFLQTRSTILRAISFNSCSVVNLGQIPCCNSQGTLSGKVGGIGRILGDSLRCERHICADFVPIFICPADEVVAVFCLCSGTTAIAAVDNRFSFPCHAAAISRTYSIGYCVLQLLQRYGNHCAAGDIVQGPSRTITAGILGYKRSRLSASVICCRGCQIRGNAFNTVARRDFNIQQEICCVEFFVFEANYVLSAWSDAEILRSVFPLTERDDSLGINRHIVLNNAYRDVAAGVNFLRPLGVEG